MSTETAVTTDQLTGDYTFDPAHSRIGFAARHAMVTKVRGSFHEFEGGAHVDAADPSNSSARLTIAATSVDTGNADRDGHLRSNDFFAMDEHPQITFASTDIAAVDDDAYDVTGDLTIKGVTRPVTIRLEHTGAATDPFGNFRIGFEGAVKVNRKDWDITFNAPLETGGVLVGEQVTLELDISAIKNG